MVNWKDFWENKAGSLSKESQVGRVVNGAIMPDDLTQKIAKKISDQLELQANDTILDVCCGNGLLSSKLVDFCASVHGVDFSGNLIAQAKKIEHSRLHFTLGDAQNFKIETSFDKAVLYFSFQYFEQEKIAQNVLHNLIAHVKNGGIILVGDIPDRRKLLNFYNTPFKLFRWVKQEITHTNDMGRFWHPTELVHMCSKMGVEAIVQKQEKWQPYGHYRFDLLIRKPN